MSSENILNSSLLDIVFHNRHKDYGAYQLRKDYPRRLYLSLGVMTTIVIVFTVLSNMKSPKSESAGMIFEVDSTVLKVVDIPEPVQPKPVAQENRAIVKSSVPVIVAEAVETEVPENKDLENKLIGTFNRDGNDVADNIAGPPPSSGITGEPTAPAEEPKAEVKEEILVSADIMPEYPGGTEALRRFLSRNLRNPDEELTAAQAIRVVVRFVVDKDGTISQVIFKENGGAKFEQEVARVLKKMPRWKPGVFKGKPASVYFTLPVVFQTTDQ